MRYLILALMIALLPLRGWAGNVMGTEMAVQTSQKAAAQTAAMGDGQADLATTKVAAPAQITWVAGTFEPQNASHQASMMSPDCLEHLSSADGEPADAGCGDCAACQICHTVALTGVVLAAPSSLKAGVSPQPVATPFASAEAALGQKPPIS